MPIYNVEPYVEDCIKSILYETKDINAEIICIDDCSDDNSWQKLKEISLSIGNCRCYKNHENKGVSYTRNRALLLAKGEYIWFIDPDDLLCSGVVKRFLEIAKEEIADMVIGNYKRVDENYVFENDNFHTKNSDIVYKIVNERSDEVYFPSDDIGNLMCAVWAGIFNRKFLLKYDLKFKEGMIAQEDTLFYFEVEQYATKIIKVNEICYLYRQRKSSVMHQKSEKRMQAYYKSMVIMLDTYYCYLNSDNYKNKKKLSEKICQSHENVCCCLAKCTDENFVRYNFKKIKQKGYYPYKFRKETLKKKNRLMALFDFVLPIEPLFWMVHFFYSRINKKRFKDK